MFHANPEALSALSVLHCLAGFGTPEEILNTRPRLGEPFKKPEYARIGAGLGALAERIANEFIALGGEIRFNSAIGTIVCEPVPTRGSKRYCAICTCLSTCSIVLPLSLFLFVMSPSASLSLYSSLFAFSDTTCRLTIIPLPQSIINESINESIDTSHSHYLLLPCRYPLFLPEVQYAWAASSRGRCTGARIQG
jgi:hypothetical protein